MLQSYNSITECHDSGKADARASGASSCPPGLDYAGRSVVGASPATATLNREGNQLRTPYIK